MVSAKLNMIKDTFQKYWKVFLFVFFIIVIIFLAFHSFKKQQEVNELNSRITTMSSEHAKNVNSLQNELGINKQNAGEVQEYIISAQNGSKQPQIVYIERTTPGATVVNTVREKLVKNDSTLPPEALAKTDKTVVVEQPNNKDVPVGIYKINTYRNWELGVGVGVHEGDVYIPVSLQRNYSKNHSVEVTAHIKPSAREVNGAEVKYNIHF